MRSPVSPIVANPYMEYSKQKAISTATHPLECGLGMCVQKEVHKQNLLEHITSVDPTKNFQWKTRRKGPFPSWIPLSNQKLMVDCFSQHIGSLPTQINIYSEAVTITYQPSKV